MNYLTATAASAFVLAGAATLAAAAPKPARAVALGLEVYASGGNSRENIDQLKSPARFIASYFSPSLVVGGI
jgi:hypothetical protein